MRSSLLIAALFYCLHSSAQGQKTKVEYFCAPCGCKNDGKVFDAAGTCPLCGMLLQQVGTFSYEMPAVSADGDIMAYVSYKPDNVGRVFFRKTSGNDTVKLIGEGSMPQISFDKKYVVFEGNENKIFLYDINGDSTVDISPQLPGVQSPAWQPTGNLVFAAGKFPKIGIYIMNISDKKIQTLRAEDGMRYGCKVSPDGKKIAYRWTRRLTDTIFEKGIAVYDIEKAEEKLITTIGEYPSWSPDGKQLAFHWKGQKYFAVFVVNMDGTELKKIAEDKDGDSELPVWSGDGRKLFFQTNRIHGNWEIWVMNADGSNQEPFIWE